MHFYQNKAYVEEVDSLLKQVENIQDLQGKTVLLSGVTGMLGSLVTDLLLYGNKTNEFDCKIIGLARNLEKAKARFEGYSEKDGLYFVQADISQDLDIELLKQFNIDYVIHAASNTHPVAYATDPVNTVLSNILGAKNLLDVSAKVQAKRFLFLSSVEIYGENRGDVEKFDEEYCGYIDCNTLRATYPEGKRASESLCHAYYKQYGIDFVIARLSRAYGPTLQRSDTKAMSQFLWNALRGEDIVLKSEGKQKYSYLYAGDAARALLWLLTNGECGEAYNVVGKDSDIELRELARIIAEAAGTKVVFQLPDAVEAAGFSKATKAMLDDTKIRSIGFQPNVDINDGIARTIRILNKFQ